jgi:hypothetical protein
MVSLKYPESFNLIIMYTLGILERFADRLPESEAYKLKTEIGKIPWSYDNLSDPDNPVCHEYMARQAFERAELIAIFRELEEQIVSLTDPQDRDLLAEWHMGQLTGKRKD